MSSGKHSCFWQGTMTLGAVRRMAIRAPPALLWNEWKKGPRCFTQGNITNLEGTLEDESEEEPREDSCAYQPEPSRSLSGMPAGRF